jgi:hypothetical protein
MKGWEKSSPIEHHKAYREKHLIDNMRKAWENTPKNIRKHWDNPQNNIRPTSKEH